MLISLGRRTRILFTNQPTIVVASACSGSYIVLKILDMLFGTFKYYWGYKFEWAHAFACEDDGGKQQFLRDNHSLKVLVDDVEDLKPPTVVDSLSGDTVALPHSTLFVAGFVCVSRAAVSSQRAQNKGCVARGEEKTGVSFANCFQYVKERKPSIVILENVTSLMEKDEKDESDAQHIVKEFQETGYTCTMQVVEARDHGSLAMRKRIFFIAVQGDRKRGLFATVDSEIRQLLQAMQYHAKTLTLRIYW